MSPNRYSTGCISFRAGLVLIFVIIGFIFPVSFALAAFVAFSIYADLTEEETDENRQYDFLVNPDTTGTDWKARLHKICDSPAETAFLDAMIDAFALKPTDGRLVGGGISLGLQVSVDNYRLDFLVNKRLVVEIDGAAYHSSPEAVARDRRRDEYLRERGYEILRIPAKYPLYIPGEAIDRVRKMLPVVARQDQAKGAELEGALRPARVFGALRDSAQKTGREFSEVIRRHNQGSDARRAQISANAQVRVARVERELQAELDADPELRKIYESLDEEFR